MSSKELLELGRLIVDFPIQYVALKRLEIKDTYNQHGILTLELIAAKVLQEKDVLRLQNTPIKIATPSGETIFCGICEAVHLNSEAMYTEATIVARSLSAQTDIKKNSRTFQNPGKTISQVAQTVMSAYGSVVEVKEDINLPDMLNQSQETDWAFLKRIAGQYGFVLFTDCKSSTLKISIGPVGFGQKTLDDSAYSVGMSKSVDGYICTKNNISSEASACEYEEGNYQSYDLSIGSGYLLPESKQVVMSSKITSQRGTVTNSINLKREEGTYASFKEAAEPVLTANIISGTVLEVNQNEIKVHFDVDSGQSLGEARWIPYENELNNYVYSMPDIGDKVFVYYDKQGKVIGMGSKRTDESGHPDYDHPENKSLTSCDKMIKFTPNTIEWVGSRGYYDAGDGSYQAEITFDNEAGISLYSTHDILIDTKSKGHGSVIIHAAEDFIEIKEPPQTFEGMDAAGKAKYEADGGIPLGQQQHMAINAEGNAIVKQFTEGVKGMVTGPFQIFSTLESIFVPQKELKSVTPEAIEMFETGVIYLMAQNQVKFTVGESSITLSNAWINIKTPVYRHLGFEKKQYEQQSMPNRTWLDTILDGAQLVLDIVGCLPIPIVGEVADLVNAGISLARGDYFGAAASLISAIPGGDIIGKGMKVAKAAAKGAKYLDKVETIIRVTRIICTGAQALNGILVNRDQIAEVFTLMKEGKFDITNQEHWDMLIEASRATVLPMVQCGVAVHNKRKSDKRRKQEAEANKKVEESNATAKDPEHNNNKESTCDYDPINVATGSFTISQPDLVLIDLGKDFELIRSYESIYTNDRKQLGSCWIFNISTYLTIKSDEIIVLMPNMHLEKFKREEHRWVNERAGDASYTLKEAENGYLLHCMKEKYTYYYNQDGNLEKITDSNSNTTRLTYEGQSLKSLQLASGQVLAFEYDHDKICKITDTIGRTLCYTYEGDYLKTVTYPNGGIITYEYTTEGYIASITDQNGHTYVRNTYDRKGRVIKQNLANGEEYTILYDDANRTNTYFTASNQAKVAYVYNRENLVVKTIYSDDTYEETRYDQWENKVYEKDRKGNEIFRKYNEKCLLLEERLPNGLITSYEYNEFGYVTKMYNNADSESLYIYDDNGNLIQKQSKIDALQKQTIINKVDYQGRVIETIGPRGEQVKYSYDEPFSTPTRVVTPEQNAINYQYDKAGRNMCIANAYGKVAFAYNHMNYRTMIIDDEGNTTKYYYDKLGNLEKEILPNALACETGLEVSTSYFYNELDRLIRTKDPLGNIFALKRNTEGKVTKEIHPSTYNPLTDDGEGIINIYDEEDRKIKMIYPDGGIERIKYDASGNIIKKIQPEAYNEALDDGTGYEYDYDCVNRLTQIKGPDGVVIKRYVYDLEGYIIKEINATGYLKSNDDETRVGILYSYNYLGWLVEKRIPIREEEQTVYYELTQYEYDLSGNLIKEKRYLDEQDETTGYGRVHTISFDYDHENRLTKVSDCTGAVMEYRYDCLNHRTYEKRKINEAVSQITNYTYNSVGRLIEISQSADKSGCGKRFVTTKYEYDKTGNLIKIVTPKGYVIERAYDVANHLIKEMHHDETSGIHNSITLEYDAAGNVVKMTDVNGHNTSYCYDLLNREIMKTNPVGATSRHFFNKNGQICKAIQPVEYEKHQESGAGYQYLYDVYGRLTHVIDPTGAAIETNTYDLAGQLVQKLDALQSGIVYTYDLGGRQEKIETTGGASQCYAYDARGNIIGVADGNGQRTNYCLDKWGRISQIYKPDETTESYTYDFAGNIVTTTDAKEQTITYNFNNINKLSEMIDQEGNKENFTYDAEGYLKEHLNRNGIKVRYEFNMYGSLLRKRQDESDLSESYIYYPDGRLQSALAGGMRYQYTYYPDGKLKEKSASGRTLLAYSYDLNGNKISQKDVTGKTTQYCYNSLDELIEIIDNEVKLASYTYHPDGSMASMSQLNGLYTQYTYDANKNLSGLEVTLEGKALVKNAYTYDGNGNRLEKQQLNGTTSYQYDDLNRLTKVMYPNYSEELYYDQVGNRSKRIASGIEELYNYDVRNRLTSLTTNSESGSKTIQYAYDNQGNLLVDDKARYTYDGFNRTEKVETFDGNVQINHYDAEGLRHEIEENGKLVQFIFNTNREVVVEKSETDTLRLIRGYDITASESEQARTYYHYVSDELGSTTHIFEGKECRNYYEYDAFGKTVVSEEEVGNRFKYTGQQHDPITQQYYLRARYYNPVIARFTQEDVYRGAGLNLYAYCDNNPVTYFDPSGYSPCPTKQDLYKKYRAEGYNAIDANNLANADLIRKNQGEAAAQQYANAHPLNSPTTMGYDSIRAYNNIDLNQIPVEYRADPRLTTDMDFKGQGSSGANAAGWERNANKHYNELLDAHPEYWSDENVVRIEAGRVPIVDSTFASHFPQYSGCDGDKLIHHHIGGGGQVAAVPSTYHPGYGGIHNVEKATGVRENDNYTGIAQTLVKNPE